MKLTRWFTQEQKPVRPGIYETKYLGQPISGAKQRFSFWDGSQWGLQFSDFEMVTDKTVDGGYQEKSWRGLANPPKQSKGEK